MYRQIILLFLVVSLKCAMSQEAGADSIKTFSLFQNGDSFVDLKFIDPEKGSFGVDFKLDFKRSLTTSRDDFKNLYFGLSSNGYVTVKDDQNPVNSIISELKLQAFPFMRVAPRKTVYADVKHWKNFIEDSTESKRNEELINESRKLAEKVSSPFYLFLNVHAKHETTQQFNSHDFAFGIQLSFTTSFLNSLLDFPFSLVRYGKNNNARHLDVSMGYDYVTDMQNTGLATLLEGESAINRLNFKCEWETGILSGRDRLILLLDSYHFLDPSQNLKQAGKHWNTFFMAKIEHILNQDLRTNSRTKVSIKYTNGELPPNFVVGHVLGAGFSVEF